MKFIRFMIVLVFASVLSVSASSAKASEVFIKPKVETTTVYEGAIVDGTCGKLTFYKSGGVRYLPFNCQTGEATLDRPIKVRVVNGKIFVGEAQILEAKIQGDCLKGRWVYEKYGADQEIDLCLK